MEGKLPVFLSPWASDATRTELAPNICNNTRDIVIAIIFNSLQNIAESPRQTRHGFYLSARHNLNQHAPKFILMRISTLDSLPDRVQL